MHNAWIRHITGRMKSDISYSSGIVYNNFPWPENPSEKQIKTIEEEIREVKNHLANLVDYCVAYYENLAKKYGKGKERKTEIKEFDTIQVKQVAISLTAFFCLIY